jgi:WD40 repeat protein
VRRSSDLVQRVLLVVLGTTIGVTAGYATDTPAASSFLKFLQRWWLPVLGGAVLLTIAVEVWRYLTDRSASPGARWQSSRPPFPGLEAFTEEDAEIFFGRERESETLFDRLHPIMSARVNRFVAVIGPSGVGKSSLVRAGLVPALTKRRRAPWVVVGPMVPGGRPVRALAEVLGWTGAIGEFAVRPAVAAERGKAADVLIIVDQAEELLTLAGPEERDEFLALLDAALADNSRLWVVAVLRSEFLTGFLGTQFAHLFANPVTVGALSRTALAEVIEKPATLAGVTFDPPSLVQTIVDDSEGGDALPLLAYTLQTLYVDRSSDGRVTPADYQAVGGVAGTLTKRADKVTAELESRGLADSVLPALLTLVTVTDGEPTRRRVRHVVLTSAQQEVADAFVAARLLTSDAQGDEAVLQVAHEALFRQWAPLAQAISQRRDELRQRADLERWAADWNRSGEQGSYLLRDERLAAAERWADTQDNLSAEFPLVAAFLDRSRQAHRKAMEGLSRSLAQRALAGLDDNPEYSLLLLLAALEECADTPEARHALRTVLTVPHMRGVLRGHAAGLEAVDWSPDGTLLATGSIDRTVRVWEADSGIEIRALGHEAPVRHVAWSPAGDRLATSSEDGSVWIWNPRDGSMILKLDGVVDGSTVAWSPDSARLATASRAHAVQVWDSATGVEIRALTDDDGSISGLGLTWSPDGGCLAVATHDRTVRIMDGRTGAELRTLGRPGERGDNIAWSPDGTRLAVHILPTTLRVLAADTGAELGELPGHRDSILDLAWSPDSARLATCSKDRAVRIWDATASAEIHALRGHSGAVNSIAWSPDGRHVVSAGEDGVARIWTTHGEREVLAFCAHSDNIIEVAWSPDGGRIATASYDHTAAVWSAHDGRQVLTLRGHTAFVGNVTWSPDGSWLSTSSYDGTARIWDARTGGQRHVLRGHHGIVAGTAWSPDGSRLASTSEDGAVYVWDAHSGDLLKGLNGHDTAAWDVTWSPDGTWLATSSNDGGVIIWHTPDWVVGSVLTGHDGPVWDVTWSPGGTRLATASSDRTARVWDTAAGTELGVLTGHESTVWRVAWSPDGTRLATASADRTSRVWDTESGAEILFLGVHSERVECVAWSPDGRRVVTASHDGIVRVWDVSGGSADPVAEARRRVFRMLTPAERRMLLLPVHE